MKTQQAKDLVGKYGLFQVGDVVDDSVLTGVSPSGNFVQLGYGWHRMQEVSFLEELPEELKPRLTAATARTDVIAGSAVTKEDANLANTQAALAGAQMAVDAALANNQKLQEQNTILNEQLARARKEIEALKAAIAAEDATKSPPGPEPELGTLKPEAGTLTFPTGGNGQ